ncbi:hypothetical protein ACFFV7_39645 [Nonomuraea spiralis]|uniref:Secreted protein n=1 Tax=Nonomuraea spiralis TaxID=46182 RepID=A0ABV5IS60_9ACTN|nr:hypothetical protein [Nonomuraea spiralis]GGT44942.1 hypothetical protein GCM10010176_105350 [Nonomuraea spiralis]
MRGQPRTAARRVRRALCAVAATVLVLITSVTPAHAEDGRASNEDYVYRSNFLCVSVHAEVRDFSSIDAGSYKTAWVDTWAPTGTIPCARQWPLPAGYLAVRLIVLVYNFDRQEWGTCQGMDSGFRYTPDETSHADWYMWDGYQSNPAPCGTAWYASLGFGYAWNGSWYGGYLPSGNVWLTSRYALRAGSQAPPPRPSWITGEGGFDRTALPDRLPLIGADGHPTRTDSGAVATVDSATLFGPPPTRPAG